MGLAALQVPLRVACPDELQAAVAFVREVEFHFDPFELMPALLFGPALMELLDPLLVEGCSQVGSHPHVAQLDHGPELPPLQRIDHVIQQIAALEELGLFADVELDFDHDGLPVDQVDEDILVERIQSVFDLDDPKDLGPVPAEEPDVSVEAHDLFFSGGALASEEIARMKGDQVDFEIGGLCRPQ